MGLELVELIMEIEERFEIEIPDEDISSLMTVRKLVDYIIQNVNIKESNDLPCYSQKSFYILRRYLIQAFNLKRIDIKPNKLLKEIFPARNRYEKINKLKNELKLISRPRLTYPSWIDRSVFYSSVLLFLIIFIIDIKVRHSSLSFLIAAVI